MARPKSSSNKKTRKSTQELLDERTLYKAIKYNPNLDGRKLTMEDIRAVFKAYSDIMYNCAKDNIRVSLPYIGEFYKYKMSGFKGGNIKIPDEPFKKGSTCHIEYRPPKPDYYILQFEIRNALKERFKEDNQID